MKKFIKYNNAIENIDNLPSYPIPDLKDTLNRYLEWVEPLISNEELEEAKQSVELFLNTEGSVKMEQKIKDLGNRQEDSWIYDYWVKCHLEVRAPLTPHTNVPIIYENKKISEYDVLERIAILMHSTAMIYKDFKDNGAGAYLVKNKLYSSDQFHGVLGSINHIREGIDEYYINDKESQNIVFNYKNHHYSIQVIENNRVVSANEILKTLENVVESTTTTNIPNVNYVTIGVDRNRAGAVFSEILEVEENELAYQKIKDAIMIMNYDDIDANDVYEELHNASYNHRCVNRWHGKGLQFSCSKNGILSFIVDHSFCDGGTEVYLINRLKQYIESEDFLFEDIENGIKVEKLEFHLSEDIKKSLLEFKTGYDQCMDSFKTKYVDFEELSRQGLREKGILSGDGFIHLAFQVAQYMTYGHINNTYISVDARKYFRGRTEANRPTTKESVNFVQEFLENKKPKEEICELMHEALNAHHRRVKLCQSGQGVNRYLYVLESIFEDYGEEMGIDDKPSLFTTKAYKTIGVNHLSTTSFGHPDMKYLYFPPVIDHGFGIFYMVDIESFMIITAYNEDLETMEKMIKNLKECIEGMLELIS